MSQEEKNFETIDLTPTWSSIVPVMLQIYRDIDNANSLKLLQEEFMRMAKAADNFNEIMKQQKEEQK